MANPTPATVKDGDQIDGLLRIVSNRCRNLRKAIERANAHEKSKEGGKEINSEQEQSIEMKAVRIAQLHELEEILKKQEALVTPPKLSKRAAKRLQKEKMNHGSAVGSVSDAGSDAFKGGVVRVNGTDGTDSLPEKLSDAHTSTDGDTIDRSLGDGAPTGVSAVSGAGGNTAEAAGERERERAQLAAALSQLESTSRSHALALRQASTAAAQAVLEIAHVVTFLSQPGGRDCVRGQLAAGYAGGRPVSDMDVEILLYFYRMLTSPNGSVPHAQAVATSAVHCEAYLECSDSEPFAGTTYRTLRDIVAAIAGSPALARREGAPLAAGRRVDAVGDGRAKVDGGGVQPNVF